MTRCSGISWFSSNLSSAAALACSLQPGQWASSLLYSSLLISCSFLSGKAHPCPLVTHMPRNSTVHPNPFFPWAPDPKTQMPSWYPKLISSSSQTSETQKLSLSSASLLPSISPNSTCRLDLLNPFGNSPLLPISAATTLHQPAMSKLDPHNSFLRGYCIISSIPPPKHWHTATKAIFLKENLTMSVLSLCLNSFRGFPQLLK